MDDAGDDEVLMYVSYFWIGEGNSMVTVYAAEVTQSVNIPNLEFEG